MSAQGKRDEAVPVLRAALKTAEVAKGTHSREIVPCIAALAELQTVRRREEEAIMLLKRAYTLDKVRVRVTARVRVRVGVPTNNPTPLWGPNLAP